MPSFAIATPESLLIGRGGTSWAVERHLQSEVPESVAIDHGDPGWIYVGTLGSGLWISGDRGRSWEPAGDGIPHSDVTAVAVESTETAGPGIVYAGTEPSTISRSQDGGRTWQVLNSLLDLPSASRWSFPPKPETHHVRHIETDPNVEGKLYVAIEAGAMVYSSDRGETWRDRAPGAPIDTHSAVTYRGAPGHIYSAAGDGYFESYDGGQTWHRLMAGLDHHYLVGAAVAPGDPPAIVVSAASGPYSAYHPRSAEAYVYRKAVGTEFRAAMDGLPDARGTVASRFATSLGEPGVIFAANNHGLFRSADGGLSWEKIGGDWSEAIARNGVSALAVMAD